MIGCSKIDKRDLSSTQVFEGEKEAFQPHIRQFFEHVQSQLIECKRSSSFDENALKALLEVLKVVCDISQKFKTLVQSDSLETRAAFEELRERLAYEESAFQAGCELIHLSISSGISLPDSLFHFEEWFSFVEALDAHNKGGSILHLPWLYALLTLYREARETFSVDVKRERSIQELLQDDEFALKASRLLFSSGKVFLNEELQSMKSLFVEHLSVMEVVKEGQSALARACSFFMRPVSEESFQRIREGIRLKREGLVQRARERLILERDRQREGVIQALSSLGVKMVERAPEFMRKEREFLKLLAVRNNFGCIDKEHVPAELTSLVKEYNTCARVLRVEWLQKNPGGGLLSKKSKRGLHQAYPFRQIKMLGDGAEKVVLLIEMTKPPKNFLVNPNERSRIKPKVLALLSPNGNGHMKHLLDDARLSRMLFLEKVPHIIVSEEVSQYQTPVRLLESFRWKKKEADGLLMEWASGGNLLDYIQTHTLPPQTRVRLAMELAETFLKMHSEEVSYCYCDLKPKNIVVQLEGEKNEPHLKLIDCAHSEKIGGDGSYKTSCISLEQYESHIQKKRTPVTKEVDMYGFGNILYFLCFSEDLLKKESLYFNMLILRGEMYGEACSFVKPEAIDAVRARYRKLPEKVMSTPSSWVPQQLRELIAHMLDPNPNLRPQAVDILHACQNMLPSLPDGAPV